MNFKRGQGVKESLDIGIEKDSVSLRRISGKLYLRWAKSNSNYNDLNCVLERRWFIPMKKVLPLLNQDSVSIRDLRRYFYIRPSRSLDFTDIFEIIFLWGSAKRAFKKIIKIKSYIEMDMTYGRYEMIDSDNDSITGFSFKIQSEDTQKIIGIDRREGLKGLIYKGKTYPIKMGEKQLTL
jgi:hypothetical protein